MHSNICIGQIIQLVTFKKQLKLPTLNFAFYDKLIEPIWDFADILDAMSV